MTDANALTSLEFVHLNRCVELATEAADAGDEPFGSVLVHADGTVLAEDRNRVVATGDQTQHPEFALARWATTNVKPADRSSCTVFTSGEHCAMCSAAHGWVGLGRIVYIHSSAQLTEWLTDWGVGQAPVRPIPIQRVVPGIEVVGPVPELVDQMRTLHRRYFSA